MVQCDRRFFLKTVAAGLAATGLGGSALAADGAGKRRFTLCLAGGPVGVSVDPRNAIEIAVRHGYESIEPSTGFIAKLSDGELKAYLERMREAKLAWGAAGLPVEFRAADEAFQNSIKSLPDFAKTLQRAGATRVATWLSPSSRTLTYVANFRQHAQRLRECAKVLGDHGVRLGLEYVGPKTSWSAGRYPFIHTMAEMKDLIAEINRDNVGFLLDCWHWYTAHETEADLLTLKAQDVVLCHVNDAPAGVAVDQQVDSRRGLPCSTGVIDIKTFLGAMVKIGYDGPIVCEPFTDALRGKKPEEAMATVAAALKKAASFVE